MTDSNSNRPNILFVLSDQQRWDTVGAHGSPLDITPNLDQVGEAGTVFERTFSPQPVCGPARACIQTGMYATNCNGYDNGVSIAQRGTPTYRDLLANVLSRLGYDTGYVGKWHLSQSGTEPIPASHRGGYEFWRAADVLEHTSHPYEGLLYNENDEPTKFDGYRVDYLTEKMIDFIERDREAPFFGFLSYLEPHHQNDMERYVAPEGYAYRHRNPTWIPPDLSGTPGDWYEELPDYYGICERIDECFGHLVDKLEKTGELENTIIIFTSDHGSHFRTRNGEYKRSCHESSIRVPCLVRGPGFNGGGKVDELVNLIDLAPTLLDAADATVPARMDGRSLVPLVGGDIDEWREDVFIQPMSSEEVARTIRTNRWKYSVYAPEADPWEDTRPDQYIERLLYDLAADPYEQVNLIGRDDHRHIADRLCQRLQARIESVESYCPVIHRTDYQA